MTPQDIISELSDHGFTDTSSTRSMWMINDTVWDICSRMPWPFLEKTIDLTFNGSSATPTNMPTDFRAVIDMTQPSTGYQLQPKRLDDVDKAFSYSIAQGTVGTPMAYYFIAGTLYVYQVPPAGTVLRMRYTALHPALLQTDVESAILIPKQHHRAIVLGCLWRLYDMEDDPEMSSRFEGHYENRIKSIQEEMWVHQYDRPDRIYVIDDEDESYPYAY